MQQIHDRHWYNCVPDTGTLITSSTGEGGATSRSRQYKLDDGRIATSAEIHRSADNVHGVPAATIRRRLCDGIRDRESLFAPPQNRGRGSAKAKARREEVAA